VWMQVKVEERDGSADPLVWVRNMPSVLVSQSQLLSIAHYSRRWDNGTRHLVTQSNSRQVQRKYDRM
jgi:hypothetical protein